MRRHGFRFLSVLFVAVMLVGVLAGGAFADNEFEYDNDAESGVKYFNLYSDKTDADGILADYDDYSGTHYIYDDIEVFFATGDLEGPAVWQVIGLVLGHCKSDAEVYIGINGFLPADIINLATNVPGTSYTWGNYWDTFEDLVDNGLEVYFGLWTDDATSDGIVDALAEGIFADRGIAVGGIYVEGGAAFKIPQDIVVGELYFDEDSTADFSGITDLDFLADTLVEADDGAKFIVPNGITTEELADALKTIFGGADKVPEIVAETADGSTTWTADEIQRAVNPTGSSGGGCDAGFGGLFGILALAGAALISRGKRS
jgi:hypothetical protein